MGGEAGLQGRQHSLLPDLPELCVFGLNILSKYHRPLIWGPGDREGHSRQPWSALFRQNDFTHLV